MKSQKVNSPKVVILGHVCIDENSIEGVSYRSWGSPAMYVAAYYAREYGVKTHIISEYGKDFTEYIHEFTAMATAPREGRTLIYRNNVENEHRIQFCPNPEDSPVVPLDESIGRLIASADIFIVAPNIPNYSSLYVSEAISHTKQSAKKILMPQGLLRAIDYQGLITRASLGDPSVIGLFDVLVISDEDISNAVETATAWSREYTKISIIITRAREGATLLHDSQTIDIPTPHPLDAHEIINSVGAGDMFSAEIAIKLFEGVSTELAIEFAHSSTARMLTARKQQGL